MSNRLILELHQVESLDVEIKILSSVKTALSERCGPSEDIPEITDKLFSGKASEVNCRNHLRMLNLSKSDLEFLLYHIFNRRFGWSECDRCQDNDTVSGNELSGRKFLIKDELKAKNLINGILDDIINLLFEESPSLELLEGFRFAILNAQGKPVVRNRTIIHVMDWIARIHLDNETIHQELFHVLKNVIVLALTDIWSAIRNSCVSRLSHLVEFFTSQQVQDFFAELVNICYDSTRSWQAREGAMIGISCIIRRFRWNGFVTDESGRLETMKITMPEFISLQMQSLIFQLLADSQLTVREHAIKAYSLYISRCEVKEVLSSFHATVSQLDKSNITNTSSSESNELTLMEAMTLSTPSPYPLLIVMDPSFQFLDAYLAEGLLGLSITLIKHLPSGYLLSNWNKYISAFNLHLMHPASTVRQATSVAFKFIVAKNSSSPLMLKLVLRNLISCWFPNLVDMTRDQSSSDKREICFPSRLSVTDLASFAIKDKSTLCSAWQWREGRLLSYELIFQFLIKNHWLYTFGSSSCQIERDDNPVSFNKTEGNRSTSSRHFSLSGSSNLYSQTNQFDQEFLDGRKRKRSHSFTLHNLGPRSHLDSAHFALSTDHLNLIIEDCSSAQDSKPCWKQMDQSSLRRRRDSVSSTMSPHPLGRRYSYYGNGGATCQWTQVLLSRNGSLLSQCLSEETEEKLINGQMNESVASQSTSCVHQEQRPVAADEDNVDCLDDLRSILCTIFYECVESLADTQWELRRMGHQLLPHIVEVICWFDVTLLTNLCDVHFMGRTTLLDYGMSLAIKYSIRRAADLNSLLCSSHLWQDAGVCQELVENITTSVQKHLADWCSAALAAVERPIIDKISIVAVEVLLLIEIHFHSSTMLQETDNRVFVILSAFVSIFVRANTQVELTRHLVNSPWFVAKEIIPQNGFLSCCTKSDTSLHSSSSQVEKAFLSNMQSLLPSFCQQIHNYEALILLPILIEYFLKYADDDGLLKSISESIAAISTLVSRWKLEISDDEFLVKNIQLCLRGLSLLIGSKQTDLILLKHVLSLCHDLLLTQPDVQHNIETILRAVISRGIKTHGIKPGSSIKNCLTYTDFSLLSNDIPSLPQEMAVLDCINNDEDEDDAVDCSDPRVIWETQILNSSIGSGIGLSSRAPPATIPGLTKTNGVVSNQTSHESGGGSDWDSDWSDEEDLEDTDEMTDAIQQFLRVLEQDFMARGIVDKLLNCFKLLSSDDQLLLLSFHPLAQSS